MKEVKIKLPETWNNVKSIIYKGTKYINLNWIPQADGKTKIEKM